MTERIVVTEAGVPVQAAEQNPVRVTVLDGELQGSAGDLTGPAFLVAEGRAMVELEPLPPFSVRETRPSTVEEDLRDHPPLRGLVPKGTKKAAEKASKKAVSKGKAAPKKTQSAPKPVAKKTTKKR